MNDHAADRELPYISNDQIEYLDAICKRASQVVDPPWKALFHSYDEVFKEKGLDRNRDNEIFRWLLRVGESARRQYRAGRRTNLVPHLRSILEAHGITVIDHDDNKEINGVTRSLDDAEPVTVDKQDQPKRRVSFDDARLEETWLSERSQLGDSDPESHSPQRDQLRPRPRAARDFANTQRARSTSSQRPVGSRHPAPKHYQEESPSTEYASEYGEQKNGTLLFEPSLTQLEQNAEAFFATSEIRCARQCLHQWHDRALALRNQRSQAFAYASAQDRRKLLKESFDVWRSALGRRRDEQNRIVQLERIADDFRFRQSQLLAAVALSHLEHEAKLKALAARLLQEQRLEKKYFNLWHKHTIEETAKVNSLLWRKCLTRWREKTVRRAIEGEQAHTLCREALLRKYCQRWLWTFRSRMAVAWHEQHVVQVTFGSWISKLERRDLQVQQAEDFHRRTLATSALRALTQRAAQYRPVLQESRSLYDRKLLSGCLKSLQIHAKLTPLAATLSLKVRLNLQRKVIRVWNLRLTLNRQAADVSRKRVLQSAWTSWNDALRCKALAQRIDERVLVESVYHWMLQARLKSFQRSQDVRLLRRTLTSWNSRIQDKQSRLEQASVDFAEGERWRRLKFGMLRLNKALRNQEDADRAAVEFSNSRALPDVMEVWKQQTAHARQLAKWAYDARFYVLCSRTLRAWQERTVQHKHQRRRQAYAQVRARVKIRLVRDCFTRWRTKSAEVSSMQVEAHARDQARLFQVGTHAFDKWREKTAQHAELELQARAADNRKLLTSATAALMIKYVDLTEMEQQSILSKQESDLALLGSALKRIQWAGFTARRRVESADALEARNRDQHVKQMLRHWSSQAIARRKATKAKSSEQRDAESPSLRPASRAASRSRERSTFASSPPAHSTTPAYMRTPSRSRRAGRFRPLPTPAHVTPMAFDRSYLVTTPAPLSQAQPNQTEDSSNIFEGLTPQITPFARKLRAGGVTPAPPSALRSSILGRSAAGGTNKSVRFAGSSRFGSGSRRLHTTDEQAELNS
ncbi:hypothetical protein M409DRAFT_25857 [Zasmidium cellare ATCC 36951]|uniref:Sfi1 spindle body domain-containing protein n=1 Tax=Zasmidium cellare ATCC 36951 TaxID=1080233 RepID=A0A6A6CDA4_ZASCE|nr:uncharacterized protein M409DRAFT_25857 [Zasmidium cellare ATCC 36951]KAF2163669.1 hypothetical protein M409DRAFT_25857 [Zasmidium cellare ATCC 36951]